MLDVEESSESMSKSFSNVDEVFAGEILSKEDKKKLSRDRRHSLDENLLSKYPKDKDKDKEKKTEDELSYYLDSIHDNITKTYGNFESIFEYIKINSKTPLDFFENLLFYEEYGMIKTEYYEYQENFQKL